MQAPLPPLDSLVSWLNDVSLDWRAIHYRNPGGVWLNVTYIADGIRRDVTGPSLGHCIRQLQISGLSGQVEGSPPGKLH